MRAKGTIYALGAGVARKARRAAILQGAHLPKPLRSNRQLAREAIQRGALQKVGELAQLAGLVRRLAPRYVVEIGTAQGGTLYLWCLLASDHAVLISMDLPGAAFSGDAPPPDAEALRALRRPHQRIHLIRTDSHAPEAYADLSNHLGGESIDFLFIDGDHTYAGVRGDFETYGKLVRPGGLIALHDIVPHPHEPSCEVHVLWAELGRRFVTTEFVDLKDDRHGQWGGIGVIERPLEFV